MDGSSTEACLRRSDQRIWGASLIFSTFSLLVQALLFIRCQPSPSLLILVCTLTSLYIWHQSSFYFSSEEGMEEEDDTWVYTDQELLDSPSRADRMTKEEEDECLRKTSIFISMLIAKLNPKTWARWSTFVLFRRFYRMESFRRTDRLVNNVGGPEGVGEELRGVVLLLLFPVAAVLVIVMMITVTTRIMDAVFLSLLAPFNLDGKNHLRLRCLLTSAVLYPLFVVLVQLIGAACIFLALKVEDEHRRLSELSQQ